MYAVIKSGGKQERVEEGSVVEVELLKDEIGSEVTFSPILVVDGSTVRSRSDELSSARVTAVVIGESKADKIVGFKYHAKANVRKHWGHRQRHSVLRVTSITAS
ncbi:MAG: 50S ribosomal protein L21 [Acidimicrobiales bacterium]|jgi:large subunit ribosomal protein L21